MKTALKTGFGNLYFKTPHIIRFDSQDDELGRIYFQQPGEIIRIEPVYANIENLGLSGLPFTKVITGANFLRVRAGVAYKIPLEDFRPIKRTALNKIITRRQRVKIRAKIRELLDAPSEFNGRPSIF